MMSLLAAVAMAADMPKAAAPMAADAPAAAAPADAPKATKKHTSKKKKKGFFRKLIPIG